MPRNQVSVRECHVTCTDTHITHRWRKEAAQTKCTLRKNAQGSARGQCPVLFYEADGGRRAQQEGAAGGREERQQGAQEEAQAEAQVKKILIDPGKNL